MTVTPSYFYVGWIGNLPYFYVGWMGNPPASVSD